MADLKLLCHFQGSDGDTSGIDHSTSNHTLNFGGTAQYDVDQKKFGTTALLLDGNSDSINIDNSADWDVFASNADDWTISCFVKHTDHDGTEAYVAHYEDGNNRWFFGHVHGSGIQIWGRTGGNEFLNIFGSEITDSDWHHVAMCKVANLYGLYVGGTQTGYDLDNDTGAFTGSLFIGQVGDSGSWYAGHVDELRIINANPFGAAPNDTPDDTITVPTGEHSPVSFHTVNVHDCTDLKEKVGG